MAKPIIVTTTKTKRKVLQRYKFSIDKPGKADGETNNELYTRPGDAERGARSMLRASKDQYGWWCLYKGNAVAIRFIRK